METSSSSVGPVSPFLQDCQLFLVSASMLYRSWAFPPAPTPEQYCSSTTTPRCNLGPFRPWTRSLTNSSKNTAQAKLTIWYHVVSSHGAVRRYSRMKRSFACRGPLTVTLKSLPQTSITFSRRRPTRTSRHSSLPISPTSQAAARSTAWSTFMAASMEICAEATVPKDLFSAVPTLAGRISPKLGLPVSSGTCSTDTPSSCSVILPVIHRCDTFR